MLGPADAAAPPPVPTHLTWSVHGWPPSKPASPAAEGSRLSAAALATEPCARAGGKREQSGPRAAALPGQWRRMQPLCIACVRPV